MFIFCLLNIWYLLKHVDSPSSYLPLFCIIYLYYELCCMSPKLVCIAQTPRSLAQSVAGFEDGAFKQMMRLKWGSWGKVHPNPTSVPTINMKQYGHMERLLGKHEQGGKNAWRYRLESTVTQMKLVKHLTTTSRNARC